MFTTIIIGLCTKIAISFQFNEDIGPLIKIVQKMGSEFVNFLIFYMILTLMFVLVGNALFMFYCPAYSSIFNALTTITNAAMGNFTFTDFDLITDNIYL